MAGNATNSSDETTLIANLNTALTKVKGMVVNSGDQTGQESRYVVVRKHLTDAILVMNSIHDPNP